MGNLSRLFCATVVVIDLLAVVYFGGHFVLTGHILPPHGKHHNELADLIPVAEGDAAAASTAAPKEVPDPDVSTLAGDPERGRQIAAKCRTCHAFEKGAPHRIGPTLWGVFGHGTAHYDNFAYSDGMLALKGNQVWDEEHLYHFLKSPRRVVKGTKMAFAGLRDPQERADVIAYLKSLK